MSIALRKDIDPKDQWDLSKLCSGIEQWKADLIEVEAGAKALVPYQGTLGASVEGFIAFWKALQDYKVQAERLSYYSFLRHAADGSDAENQELKALETKSFSELDALLSWVSPEITALPEDFMQELYAHPDARDASVALAKIRKLGAHILKPAEEEILALHKGARSLAQEAYSALVNSDMDMGSLVDETGVEKPLSPSTFASFMQSRDPELRKRAYTQAFGSYDKNKNTLATLLAGAVKSTRIESQSRKFASSLEAALEVDQVPVEVYHNLISTVNEGLPILHEYYDLKRKELGFEKLAHWDVYAPMVKECKSYYSYEDAVDLIEEALAPLGEEYTSTLRKGLLGGWVDRYENKGKRSGAFSAGSYLGEPYILMSYKPEVIRSLFTLAHEAGHSMHSYYSVRSNPFEHYRYTIFETEVASTFNEKLLTAHMLKTSTDPNWKRFLLNKEMDDMVATLFRQCMFAEFEYLLHHAYQEGQALTLAFIRESYGALLRKYFGPEVVFHELSDLECFRIPHFYKPFYVYKYATGISASIDLSKQVLSGKAGALESYYGFLKSGGSQYPLDNLRNSGVDMTTTAPVKNAIAYFEELMHAYKEI